MAYRSSQASGLIGAIAANLRHSHSNSNKGSELYLRPTQLTAMPDSYNPLSEARDQTRILMDTGQVHFHCATMGTLYSVFLCRVYCVQIFLSLLVES